MVEDIKKIEVENQQKNTKLKLFKGNCVAVGRKSKYSLYKKELVTYSSK